MFQTEVQEDGKYYTGPRARKRKRTSKKVNEKERKTVKKRGSKRISASRLVLGWSSLKNENREKEKESCDKSRIDCAAPRRNEIGDRDIETHPLNYRNTIIYYFVHDSLYSRRTFFRSALFPFRQHSTVFTFLSYTEDVKREGMVIA